MHQVSEKTIDFIKLIFDGIIEEDSITDEIKTLLLSLQIPVIKAAMLDAEFFVDDQHPARQLLDKIAEAGVGVTEHTDPVYIDIEKIVRKLLTDYNEDVVAFSVALEELNALTEEIYRKAREAEMASQKAVKMAHAKNVVLQEIRKVTLGKELPLGVRTLVLKIWPSMMFNHYLKHGKGNDEWVELLMILQKIIESVQPVSTLQALEELGLTHHDIIDATRSKLKRCKKKQAVLDQALADLQSTYDELMATTGLSDETAAEEPPNHPLSSQYRLKSRLRKHLNRQQIRAMPSWKSIRPRHNRPLSRKWKASSRRSRLHGRKFPGCPRGFHPAPGLSSTTVKTSRCAASSWQ